MVKLQKYVFINYTRLRKVNNNVIFCSVNGNTSEITQRLLFLKSKIIVFCNINAQGNQVAKFVDVNRDSKYTCAHPLAILN